MKHAFIYSKIFLKSGNIAECTFKVDQTEVDDMGKDIKDHCKTMAKFFIGDDDLYDIKCGNLQLIQGTIAFRPENVEAAIVTYEIIEA